MMTGIIINPDGNLLIMNSKEFLYRLAIGPRDLENNTIEVARRDTLSKEGHSN